MRTCLRSTTSHRRAAGIRAFAGLAVAAAMLATACGTDGAEKADATPTTVVSSSSTAAPTTTVPTTETIVADDGPTRSGDAPAGQAWIAEGYGDVVVLDGNTVTAGYQPAGGWCVDVSDDMPPTFELEVQDDGTARLDAGKPLILSKIETPPECLNIPTEVAAQAPIEAFVDYMDRYYPFFDERGVDWPTARTELLRGAQTVPSPDAAAVEIANFLVELGDGHMSISHPSNDVEATVGRDRPPLATISKSKQRSQVTAFLGDSRQERANGLLVFGNIDADTSYLGIDQMLGFSGQAFDMFEMGDFDAAKDVDAFNDAVDEALTSGADTDTLIIDLRGNGGGITQLVLELVARFIDEPTDLFLIEEYRVPASRRTLSASPSASVHFDGEVVVLVDGGTGSAAEGAAQGLRVAGATVVGSQTQGIWSDVNPMTLPGGYGLGMTNQIWTTMDGSVLEVTGVTVDVETSPLDALTATLTDAQIAALPEIPEPDSSHAVSILMASYGAICRGLVGGDNAEGICTAAFTAAVDSEGPELVEAFETGELDPGDVLQPYVEEAIESR